jgi:hypothetical protein
VILRGKSRGGGQAGVIVYRYECREENIPDTEALEVFIPQVNTLLTFTSLSENTDGVLKEGYVFSPMYTAVLKKEIGVKEEFKTCLRLEKAD